ncbi:hypothetical protein PybrP1_006027 [[Pythium] brassicae (nom. inval.)]|nr:hypothetical protein PybrP1_006027 [[Pythium] brassicae (nom. inval.)]
MFKGLTKDLSGTADICLIATDYSKLLAHGYLLPAEEEILFAFASAKEEFVFTNEALITVRGENATTTRKLVERVEFRDHQIADVKFETTGRVDRDCELKFQIGVKSVSIDVARKEEDAAKLYYKALVGLAREQEERARRWSFAQSGLERAAKSLKLRATAPKDAGVVGFASQTFDWLMTDYAHVNPRCYKVVITKALAGQPNQ